VNFLEKYFKIKENNSTIQTELIAGIITFFAMAYIVLVAPNQLTGFSAEHQAVWNAVYVASILVAVIGTLLMAFYAKMPFAQACGMGLLSVFSVCFMLPQIVTGGNVEAGYQAGLVIVFLSGILFLILSVTGVREYIARSIPECIKNQWRPGLACSSHLSGFRMLELFRIIHIH